MEKHIMLINNNYKDINPLVCGEETCKKGHSFGPTTREYYLLHYIISGRGKYVCNDKTYQVNKGQIFVIRPLEITFYEADNEEPWHYLWIGFESSINLSDILGFDILTAPECEHIFKDIGMCDNFGASKELYLCGKIFELFSHLKTKNYDNNNRVKGYVLKAKNYIESNYVNQISVEMIAKYLNLDRSYFSNLFKTNIGKSPQKYIVDYRLEKAAELISIRSFTPSQAALSCGYNDIFNFSKMFKRKFGVSPKNFMKIRVDKSK
ncbi:MAG TPA: AraC family transcriptional regulator [Clostridiaceae bacterium]